MSKLNLDKPLPTSAALFIIFLWSCLGTLGLTVTSCTKSNVAPGIRLADSGCVFATLATADDKVKKVCMAIDEAERLIPVLEAAGYLDEPAASASTSAAPTSSAPPPSSVTVKSAKARKSKPVKLHFLNGADFGVKKEELVTNPHEVAKELRDAGITPRAVVLSSASASASR